MNLAGFEACDQGGGVVCGRTDGAMDGAGGTKLVEERGQGPAKPRMAEENDSHAMGNVAGATSHVLSSKRGFRVRPMKRSGGHG